jgi:lysophospholipase L1-like esterase
MSADVVAPPRSRGARLASLILPRLAFYPFLAASLLVFPAWLPWMIAGWLLLFALRLCRKRAAWPMLGLGLGVVLVKRVDWPPALVVLGVLMLLFGALDWVQRRRTRLRAFPLAAGLLLGPAWIALACSWNTALHSSRRPALVEGRPIVCIADSLGVNGFPRELATRLRVPVTDFAQGGINTIQGLQRFPEILALKPQALVIELGGHDFIQGRGRRQTRENLEKMIRDARQAGAEVFLFEMPRGFITDPFGGLERELAREHDVELIADGAVRQLVLFSPFLPLGSWSGRLLSYDGLHPNEAGNVFLADRVEAALVRIYGEGIRSGR